MEPEGQAMTKHKRVEVEVREDEQLPGARVTVRSKGSPKKVAAEVEVHMYERPNGGMEVHLSTTRQHDEHCENIYLGPEGGLFEPRLREKLESARKALLEEMERTPTSQADRRLVLMWLEDDLRNITTRAAALLSLNMRTDRGKERKGERRA